MQQPPARSSARTKQLVDRLRRGVHTVRHLPVLRVFITAARNYILHQSANQAGSLAFSSVLSMFPLLILFTSGAAWFGEPGQAASFVARVVSFAPQLVQDALRPVIHEVLAQRNQALLTLGLFATLWTASSGMQAIRTALNKAYGIERGIAFWKARLKATVLTVIVSAAAFIAFTSVVVLPYLQPLLERADIDPQQVVWLRTSVRYGVAYIALALLFALLYASLPDTRQRVRTVLPGALVGAGMWVLWAATLSYTLRSAGKLALVYGSYAGVVATLVFLYMSATTLIFGAELNGALAEDDRPQPAEPGPS